jgi:hypothetical protein
MAASMAFCSTSPGAVRRKEKGKFGFARQRTASLSGAVHRQTGRENQPTKKQKSANEENQPNENQPNKNLPTKKKKNLPTKKKTKLIKRQKSANDKNQPTTKISQRQK